VVKTRIVGDAAAFLVGVFWGSPAPGEPDLAMTMQGHYVLVQGVAGIVERDGPGNLVSHAPAVDGVELFDALLRVPCTRGFVFAGVITDLESIAVELGDLVPGHEVAIVGRQVEALGDEPRSSICQQTPTT
jgi:hypothetical protein